jgi:hypothetical protein
MSIPLLLFMVGTGQPAMFTYDLVATVSGVLVISFGITWMMYARAKKVPGF